MVGLGDSKELHAAQILGFGLWLVLGFLCWHGSEARTHLGGAADAFGSMRNINDDETMVFVCFHRVRPAIRMSLICWGSFSKVLFQFTYAYMHASYVHTSYTRHTDISSSTPSFRGAHSYQCHMIGDILFFGRNVEPQQNTHPLLPAPRHERKGMTETLFFDLHRVMNKYPDIDCVKHIVKGPEIASS